MGYSMNLYAPGDCESCPPGGNEAIRDGLCEYCWEDANCPDDMEPPYITRWRLMDERLEAGE